MDATQMISDSILESDEEETEETSDNTRGRPVAKLRILKNEHISETELPLFLGNNVLGRDPNTCTLPLSAASVSKQHATICISVYRGRGSQNEDEMEALLWDLGSMNGTRKGRLKLTPNVRYALSEGDSLVVADIPCQYVLCGVDSVVSSQGDTRTPVSKNPSVKAGMPDDLVLREGDECTGSKACVNGDTKPRVSPKTTLVRANCLSFEQSPAQPQRTLVPESDSDDESVEGGKRRCVTLVSDSDSHKSSPICSTFLSPTNKIIPERVDESPITPSSSTKNTPYKHVSLSTEETDVDVGRQQLKKKLEIVDDSEAEEEREEERAAQGGTNSKESGQNVAVKQESNGYTEEDELPVSIPAVLTDAIPAFNIDSDTDMEGEEEGEGSAGPLTLNTNQQVDQLPNTAQFHMDSDTDIEEDHDFPSKSPKTLPSSNETTKPPHFSSVIQQPEDIDSNTDVDEEAAGSPDAAMKAKPTSFQTAQIADSASSGQLQEFHLDSDTDVDEEEDEDEGECEQGHENSKTDETLNKLDVKVIRPGSAPATPHRLHLDADNETIPASTIREPTVVVESCTISNAGAVLDTLSDSEIDMEDNSPVSIPAAVATCPVFPCKTSEALQSDSDADTDVEESSMPPAGDRANLVHHRVDSAEDVEDEEAGTEGTEKDQIPSLQRENTPGFVVPLLQNCSTPVQLSAARAPAVSTVGLSSCSDTQEDVDFAVAETQSFVLQTRDCHRSVDPTKAFVLESSDNKEDQSGSRGESLHLGLSDSSHLQCQNQALATECTQRFVSVEGDGISEDTHTCAAISAADRLSAEDDSNLDVTQSYVENEDSDRCSVASKKEESQIDLALEATQAYISSTYTDSDDSTNQDEGQNTDDTGTPPISSTVAFAETQPMLSFDGEESLATDNSVCSPQQVDPKTQTETKEMEQYGKDTQPQERHLSEAQHMTATQPICGNEESDEDSFPCLQKRKAKPLQLEEEQTQCLIHSGADETQAMVISEDDESDGMNLMPGPQKQKAKQLDEETQPLTSSEVSAVETLPIVTSKEQDSDDDDDSIPGPRRRKAKQLHLEEEESQQLQNSELSAAENQPIATCEDEDADSIPDPRKRKAKQLEDKSLLLTGSEVSADDDSVPVLSKRKAKLQLEEKETQPFTKSEISTVETEPLKTKTGLKSQKGKGIEFKADTSRASVRNLRKSRARSSEEEEKAECSVPPKRQTRGENKTLQSTKEFRGKARTDDNKGEEVKQAKQARGRKSMKQQKDDNEEKEMLEIEKNKHTVNKSPTNEQEEGKQGTETDERKEEQEEMERPDRNGKKEKSEYERKVNKGQEKSQEEENKEEVDKPKVSARGRRATRAMASQDTTKHEQDSTTSTNDDFPSRRTRSRSNSSNSVSSERSLSTLNTQEGKGSSRGRGARPSSKSPQGTGVRTSYRRTTVAVGPTEQDSSDILPQGSLSNSSNSLSPEVFNRGRRGRQQGRGRKTEPVPDFTPAVTSQSNQNSDPKPTARGRKSRKLEGSSSEVLHENDQEKADSQPTRTTRGRQQTSANGSECAATDETEQSIQEEGCVSEESLLPKRSVRSRSQKAERSTAVEESVTSTVNNGDEGKNKRKGRKTESKANTKGNDKTQKSETADKEGKDSAKNENCATIQEKRAGGAPSTQAKKNAEDCPPEVEVKESEDIKVETVGRRPRGQPSALQKERKKNEGLEESETSVTSMNQDSNEETTEPQTPIKSRSRKRQTSPGSCLVAKTPRYSSASPAASGRLRVSSLAYKVLFTGVVDEAGERVLACLGGSMAKGVADMNCLVTDKVRRTVKFLCAVAKGVPIVTTNWLEKSGKAGNFLSPDAFVVKDPEQEKKFNFCLQESLRIASSQPLLQGYNIHVTKSVKPEPVHMKDIISSSGANFLPKMPTTNKPQTVVISCEEDFLLCGPAVSASLPVVSAEFILTGILQQKLDLQYYMLSPPAASLQPSAGGRGRGRRKT